MDSPVESTQVFNMRQEFESFISDRRKVDQPSIRLNLDVGERRDRHRRRPSENSFKEKEKQKQEELRFAELLAAQSKIAELESQLSSAKTSTKRARIEFDKDLESAKSEREREILEMHFKIRQLVEAEQLAKTELAEGRQEWEKARIALEKKLRTTQREKLAFEDDLSKVKEECWEQLLEQKKEANSCRSKLDLTVLELDEVREQLKQEKARVEELTEQMNDYDDMKEKLESSSKMIMDLKEQISQQSEDAGVLRAMRADIEKMPSLEKEVNRLRTENEFLSLQKHNNLLLQEQLTSMQRKLEAAEKRSQALAQLQVEHEELKGRLHRWEALDTSGSRRPQSPCELSRRVKELQAAEAVAVDQKQQLQCSISTLDLRLREAMEQQTKTQAELNVQQSQIEKLNDIIKRLRRKMLLVTKERDSFKRILDSYESEVTVQLGPDSRVKTLEELLEGYQQQCHQLEELVEQLQTSHQQALNHSLRLEHQVQAKEAGSSTSLRADQDKLCQLQERLLEVEQELKKASEDKEVLEMKLEQRNLQGDYDPRHTKVLHFSLNPAAMAQQKREQELKRVKEENERLSTRVQLLEQAGGHVDDLTIQVDHCLESVPESKAIDELKGQLKKEELRNQRLVEAFKKTSQEFRETCYQLLGYKIDMPRGGEYRLASMYSESPHDFMLFKQGQSGEIQMLETDFSSRQNDKIKMYLELKDSIPALLSSITLDLFNQQTFTLE